MIDNERIINVGNFLVDKNFAESLTQIAVKCGKSKQYFSDLKRNKSSASLHFLDILCSKYPVNLNYLLTGEGEILTTNGNFQEKINTPVSAPSETAIPEGMELISKSELELLRMNARMLPGLLQEKDELKAENTRLKRELEKSHAALLSPQEESSEA